MHITDKSRKLLWGSSGNLCAICRRYLVTEKTNSNSVSVLGEECHIVSESPIGPRHDSNFSKKDFDEISNLILLCRIHHKEIDDQTNKYTVEKLLLIKENHEKWVKDTLRRKDALMPGEIRRLKENIPQELKLITSGKELFNLASSCYAICNDYSDNLSGEEEELIRNFFQLIQDAGLDAKAIDLDFVLAAKWINNEIKLLNQKKFYIFAEIEKAELGKNYSPFNILHLSVLKESDPRVVVSNTKEMQEILDQVLALRKTSTQEV